MATQTDTITEDDTKCSICLLIFQNPRKLPCKHTFCHTCLCRVVKEHEGKSAFPCPVCRASTYTDTRITIDTSDRLVTKFPVDREMQSHLERRQTCLACKTESKNETATVYCMGCHEHMCTDCGETHKKYKQMRNHQLRPSEEAPSSKVRNSLQELSRCPNHETENLEYICHDHDQPCCSKCAFTSHRKCDKVMLISDVIKDNKTYDASIKDRTEMIDRALTRVSKLCFELEKEPSRIATCHENIEKQLTEFKSRLNDAFENLRSTVKKAFMGEKSKLLTSTKATLKNATAKKADILNKKQELEGVLSHGDDVQKYLYMRHQPSSVDADATWQIAFTQKRIVLEENMQPSLQHARLEGETTTPKDGRCSRPSFLSRYTAKQTLLDNVLGEIKNLVEVKTRDYVNSYHWIDDYKDVLEDYA